MKAPIYDIDNEFGGEDYQAEYDLYEAAMQEREDRYFEDGF